MKETLKIYPMKKSKDVANIQNIISHIEGVVACEIIIEKQEVHILYNENFLNIDTIIEEIESEGYMVV